MKKKKIVAISIIVVLAVAILYTYSAKIVENKFAKLDAETIMARNYAELTDKDSNVENCDYVKFGAFFTRDLNNDGNAEKLLGTCKNVNSADVLYMDINVLTNGYLKDGKITINSTNFNYSINMVKDSVLAHNYISNDVREIQLNQINAGTQKLILGDVIADIGNDINNYSKVSYVTLTGTHVTDEGIETPISKTIDLTIDWYGDVRTSIYTYDENVYYNYDDLKSNTITFSFRLDELQRELLLKENVATITIPELNGYSPTEVICTNSNIETEYNEETGILTIHRNSKINESSTIENTLSRSNTYTVCVTYPQEAYIQISSYTTLTFQIEGYYIGYNNNNKEFENPKKSNVANGKVAVIFRETPKGNIYNFYVDFIDKKYVSKPNYRNVISKQDLLNLYDSEEEIKNKEYIVRWLATRGDEGEVSSMIMSETKDAESYGDKWNSTIMEEYITNTGIYFSEADDFLGADGVISVYNNDTNELIKAFKKEEWNHYSRQNPYRYEETVKHIRVETSATNLNSSVSVYNVKELNVNRILQDFTKDEVKDVELVYTYLTGVCNIVGQDAGIVKDIDYAYYISEKSYAELIIEKQKMSTQETCNNQKIYISTDFTEEGDAKWRNGEFLVEIPEEIINMEINNVTIDNESVRIIAYDLFNKGGKYFIKIVTKNIKPEIYTITIDCNMTPEPRIPTGNKDIKLYAYNEYCNDYYYLTRDIYDVDGDNNLEEYVGKSNTLINLLSPTSLITVETVSNYNEENEITIAPNIAEVEGNGRQASINIDLINNYSNTVTGIKVLGKIPFEGNTYILNGKDLNSKFSVTMAENGIQVPDELKENTVVYYSEKENPSKDLEDSNNEWTVKENVRDFSKIKTYLIDLKEYTIKVGKGYTFNYIVNIPENINYNLTSYSNHAIYYELNTEGGKLQLSTEPNKVGVRIVKKLNLNLTKHKADFESLKVAGATYTVNYKDSEENIITRILTTNSDGNITMSDLYVGCKYTIQEIKSPDNYELNDEIIEFEIVETAEGNLKLQTNSNRIAYDEQNEMVQIKTHDEPKYKIILTKVDNKTGEKLPNVVLKVDGKNYITNRDGQIMIEKLEQNREYTLSEKRADGYYIIQDVTFKLVKDSDGNIRFESNSENLSNVTINNSAESDLIQVEVDITNEKIPTYQLQILKVAENLNEENIEKLVPLSGAKFKLECRDLDIEQIATTDKEGKITINDLYQYVEGKYITGTYVLQELEAPDGYANVAEKIQFKAEKNLEGNLEINIENEEGLKSIKDISIEENNIIKIVIQDKSLFKLTKIDSENTEPLENAEFTIFKLDKNGRKIDYAKDVNGNYVGKQNENGDYVVTTNKQGIITLPLEGGYYQIVEVGYPEGYQEIKTERYFKIAGADKNLEEDNQDKEEVDVEINYIEDLVDLSKEVNAGNSYSGKKVKLMRTLDFEENSSYRDPLNSSYGDLNKDGIKQGIKEELTDKVDGSGFTPIGESISESFSGIFNGQNYEIRNLYINSYNEYVGLFGYVSNAEIKNIGITGEINSDAAMSVGGIVGDSGKSNISYCYNKCTINVNSSKYNVVIGGIAGQGVNISNCYNLGNISVNFEGKGGTLVGGIVGQGVNISNCYNSGIINCINNSIGEKNGSSISGNSFVGGIVGRYGNIINVYNTGNISSSMTNNKNIGYNITGGISGECDSVSNSYNTGEVSSSTNSSETIMNTGAITGIGSANNCYYLENIELEDEKQGVVKVSSDYMKTNGFFEMLNIEGVWVYINDSYPRLAMSELANIEETTELEIKNTIKTVKITTEIGMNSENTRTGGSITGEYNEEYLERDNIQFVEELKCNSSNTKIIEIKPKDEYYINEILINNQKVEFTEDENGMVSIPAGYFEKLTEDKHIIVKFERLIITKIDKDTNNKIPDTKFAIYSITPDKKVIDFAKNKKGEYIGEQNENNEYIVTTNENGQITPLLPVGYYKAVELQAAEGYELQENEDLRTTYFKVGNVTSDFDTDYIQNGKVIITNTKNQAEIVIKKIDKDTKQKLAGARFELVSSKKELIGEMVSNSQYSFVKNETQYYSNNNGVNNSVANAYFPIDLSEYRGIFNLSVNYTISSELNNDIGYATITTSTNVPTYSQNSSNINTSYRFIYTSGSYSNRTGTISLTGGKKYYLHIGYRKNAGTNTGNDTFYINNIDLTYSKILETSLEGIASGRVPIGKYNITEIESPLGYELNNTTQTIEISDPMQAYELTFENTKHQSDFNRANFIVTKRDKVTNEIMPEVKFMVLDEAGNYAKDYTGTIVGEKEEINGEEKYVVTTDKNGQIKLKLKIGKYKLVEVKTLEGYILEDEKEFEIKSENIDYELSWQGDIIYTYYPWKDYIRATSDGGMIQTNSGATKTISGEATVDNKEIQVTSDKGYVAKYNNKGKIEKLIQITGFIYGTEVYEDKEGNYIVLGAGKQIEIPADNTINGESVYLPYTGTNIRTIILKLNKELKVIWAKKIDSFYPNNTMKNYISENENGDYIINFANYSGSNIIIPAEDTVNGEEINIQRNNGCAFMEYTKEGKVKSVHQILSTIYNLVKKENGGYIVSTNGGIYELDSEMRIVKEYRNNINGISTGSSYSYWATKDEGFILGGMLTSNSVTISGDNTANGQEIQITSDTLADAVLIKYNKDFKVEWVKVNSWTTELSEAISSVRQDSQGNYVALLRITGSPTQYKLLKYDSNGNIIYEVELSSNLMVSDYLYTDRDNTQFIIHEGSQNKFLNYKLGVQDFSSIDVTVVNQKAGKVIVHHYLKGTGPEYGTDPVVLAEDELLEGKVPNEYTTSPNMKIEGYTLIKDENREYVIPENASGTYSEEEQHVYYYYTKASLKLVVHHYLEGTEDKLAEDENSYYNEGDHYKTNASEEVLKSYELVEVIGDEEKDIMQNEEVTYYYKIKKHEIITKVEIPEGREEKGGSISGEGMTPYEIVDYKKSSVKDIVITPDDGYRIKQIRLVSTNEEGNKTESIIYGTDATDNTEITYKNNIDGSVILTKFENMTEDKEVIVVFEPDEGKLIVHHYIENTAEKIYDDQITIDRVGTFVETSPVKVGRYILVGEPADRSATLTKQIQEKTYYYQIQYKVTTDIIKYEEQNEQGEMEEVIGGTISGRGEASYEDILKGRNSQKEIVMTPNEGFEIVQITINGVPYDYSELLQEDGEVTLGKEFFKNIDEDKHIEVEFRRKTKVHVKYLEVQTKKVLAEEELIDGYVGKDFETERKNVPNYKTAKIEASDSGITNEKEEAIEPNGKMTKDEITIIYWYEKVPSGILVKHIEKVVTKAINEETGKEEIIVTGVILDEEVIEGFAGDTKETTRKQFENCIPAENLEATEGINVKKDENSKLVTMKQDEVLEVVYWYEKEFKITTDVKEHEETDKNGNNINVKGGTISGEDESPYEKVVRSKDSIKEVKIVPDNGYRIKQVTINGQEVFVEDKIAEDGNIVLEKFTNMQEDKHIEVEFEKIPTKIIVQYKDAYTKESIKEDKIVDGFVNDQYTELRVEMEGYIPANPEPENSTGTMTEDIITITYWYTKQFKITTDVKEHEETDSEGNEVSVKGGEISGEDEAPYEIVARGETSTKEIVMKPADGYRIKGVTINGEEIEIKDLVKEDKILELPFFENIGEDKHIVVEYEKIPAKVIVHYLLQGTGPEYGNEAVILADDETIVGTVNGKYITTPNMDIEGYILIKDEKGEYIIPENAIGTFAEEDQHIYYYYTKAPLELIVHHYLEGTEDKLDEDEYYYYEVGDHYKVNPSQEVLKSYELTRVVGDEEKDITKNEEVIYYYKIKKYEIITKVEIPEGREEKGGSISGEGLTPYETVDYGKTSIEDIIITPDTGYRLKQIRLVSTSEEGNKQESIIYGENLTENAEITYKNNLDGSVILTKFENMTEDKEVIVVFEPDVGKLIVHHYIENTTEKISEDQVIVDLVGTKVETEPVKVGEYVVVEEPEPRDGVITKDVQEKIYYYQIQYKITTDVVEHDEKYKDGTVVKNVKGGSITNEDAYAHEYVLKNRNSQDIIEIVPDKDYEIVSITINGKVYDFKDAIKTNDKITLNENGNVKIEKEFFTNMQEDKHIEVEFRKKTKVYVQYLEKDTQKVLYKTEDGKDYEEITGYEGQGFETSRKIIAYYKSVEPYITVDTNENIETDNEQYLNGTMYADEITVTYWYEKIPSGIVERHIEINEKGETKELESKEIEGFVSENVTTLRKELEGYISVDGPENSEKNIILVSKDETSKTVTLKQDEVLEVWYYYEKQFEITTQVKAHEEIINGEKVKVDGGTISKEFITDENGNKVEVVYEEVLNRGDSKKEIVIKPDDGYRIKSVTINSEEKSLENFKIAEDGSITLTPENGYFKDVQEDKHIEVEFEKIPAKVIVQYKDAYTKESIKTDKVLEGFVNDKYNEDRIDIEGYIPAEPEPVNSKGTMTKETVTVIYWYTKQFKITTDVKEHKETDSQGNVLSIKGGKISGEDENPFEVVIRGETSTKEIVMKPVDGYRIKGVTINDAEIEIKSMLKEDKTITLPFFKDMQEDKHIVVEYEKIPAKVIIKYLEEGTEKPVSEEDVKEGYINDKYTSEEKEIEYYEFVKEKYPSNSKGSMTEEEITVKYYYKKLLFNMKVDKEIDKIVLNGQNVEVTDKNKAKLEIKYKDLNETKLEISYKIKVTNTEKIEGVAIIEEMIPQGFEFVEEALANWKEKDGKYTLTTEVINPGETREYKITLRWVPEETNKGKKINTAKITNTINIPNYEETTLEDNEDIAIIEIKLEKTIGDIINDIKEEVINMPKTGQNRIIYIASVLIAGTCIGVIVWRKKIAKNKTE